MFEKPFFVILTNRCNLTCRHCYNELDDLKAVKTKARDPLRRDRLQYLFGHLQRQGYKRGYFSGGEALLRDDAVDILGDAAGFGFSPTMFTNGHLFDENTIGQLAAAGLSEVRISLNELVWIRSEGQYEKIWAKQSQWVPELIDAGIQVGFVYIISRTNIEYVDETLRRARAMGAGMKTQPLYLPDHVRDFERVASNHITDEQWETLISEMLSFTDHTDFTDEGRFEVYGNPWKIVRYLRFVRDVYGMGARPDWCPTGPMLVLDSDGWFHPCLFRYDLVDGHIDDDEAVETIATRVDSHVDLKSAPCFREECLSAYR